MLEHGSDGTHNLSAYVTKALFDANTILYATTDDTPVALTVAASRIVGRKSTGNIGALTAAEILTILGLDSNLADLTTTEVQQLENIGTSVISAAEWGYLAECTAAGGALLDDAAASNQRTTLGLGTIATQAANNVDIDGGAIDGAIIGANSAVALTCTTFTSTGIDDNADGALAIVISPDEEVTTPLQPSFSFKPASDQTNIAIGTPVTVVWGTEVFDIGNNFATPNFTAPVTGKYYLSVSLELNEWDTGASSYGVALVTSNRTYQRVTAGNTIANDGRINIQINCIADMDANDTTYVTITQTAGTQQTDVDTDSVFTGILIG